MSEAVAVTVVAVVVVIAVVVARAHNCQTFPVGWKEGTRVSIESTEDGAR
jgi:hypothetical protein